MQLMDDNLIVSWNSSTNTQRMLDSSVRPRKGGAVMTRKSHGDRVDKVPKITIPRRRPYGNPANLALCQMPTTGSKLAA